MPPQCSFVQFDSRFAVNPDSPDPRRILASSRPCFLFRAIMCPTVMSSRMFAVSLWAAQAFRAFTRTMELFLQATWRHLRSVPESSCAGNIQNPATRPHRLSTDGPQLLWLNASQCFCLCFPSPGACASAISFQGLLGLPTVRLSGNKGFLGEN